VVVFGNRLGNKVVGVEPSVDDRIDDGVDEDALPVTPVVGVLFV